MRESVAVMRIVCHERVICCAGLWPLGNAHAQYELIIPMESVGDCLTKVHPIKMNNISICARITCASSLWESGLSGLENVLAEYLLMYFG
jgi:hypothetical protein